MRAASMVAALCLAAPVAPFSRPLRCRRRAAAPASALHHRYKSSALSYKSSAAEDEVAGVVRRYDAASRQQLGQQFYGHQLHGHHDRTAPRTSLAAATLELDSVSAGAEIGASPRGLPVPGRGITEVLSAALLITGNTVGPSMLVIPEAVRGLGMVGGSALLLGLYVSNLVSGLLLANVAIDLHESSECEVPSSFKDFVDAAMGSDVAGTAMAGASLASNSCFLAFGLVHAGSLFSHTFPALGASPLAGAGAFAAVVGLCAATQTNKGLEALTNAAAMALFASFAGMLAPGAAAVADPVGTLLAPGSDPDGLAAIAAAVPLMLSSLSYQNIVPSIAKLLEFDRAKSTAAIAVGSLLPLLMYEAFSFVVLGGGLDGSAAGGAAFAAFSAAALVGSSVAAVMSLAEEYESILTRRTEGGDGEGRPVQNKFSLPAVALSIAPPTAVALAFAQGGGEDLTGALHFNGAFITPLLYGVLPIVLHQSIKKRAHGDRFDLSSALPQVLLGTTTIGALGQEIVQDMSNVNWMNLLA